MHSEDTIDNSQSEIRNRRGGPKTPEGKTRSSMNNLKHGLTATSPQAMQIMASACSRTLDEVFLDLRDHYRPQDPVEDALIKRIATCLYRLEQADAMQRRAMSRRPSAMKPSPSAERVVRYERTVDLQLHRAIRALAAKREAEKQ